MIGSKISALLAPHLRSSDKSNGKVRPPTLMVEAPLHEFATRFGLPHVLHDVISCRAWLRHPSLRSGMADAVDEESEAVVGEVLQRSLLRIEPLDRPVQGAN